MIQTTETGINFEKELKNAFKKANANGVKVCLAAPISVKNREIVKELCKYAEVRSTDDINRFCIIDNDQIVFMLADDADVHKSYDAAIWVKSPFFVASFKKMFDAGWAQMKKV